VLHLWVLDMGSALRTQFMLGVGDNGGEPQDGCGPGLAPAPLLCRLRAWSTQACEETIVRHVFSRIEP